MHGLPVSEGSLIIVLTGVAPCHRLYLLILGNLCTTLTYTCHHGHIWLRGLIWSREELRERNIPGEG